MDADERWQQYWHDNGQQLVWNDWLQMYPKYNGDSHCSSSELMVKETISATCQLGEVSKDSMYEGDNEYMGSLADDQTYPLNVENLNYCHTADCENHVEADISCFDSSKDVSDTFGKQKVDDFADSLAAGVLKQSQSNDVSSSDHVVTAECSDDRDELSDGAVEEYDSLDCLWARHYAERYCYYYEWFMQWLQEEKQMQQSDSHTEQTVDCLADGIQQLATEADLYDDHIPPSDVDNVAASRESLNIVESLLSELLLTVVISVDQSCPADGNGQNQKKKKAKQHKHGMFFASVFQFSTVVVLLDLFV